MKNVENSLKVLHILRFTIEFTLEQNHINVRNVVKPSSGLLHLLNTWKLMLESFYVKIVVNFVRSQFRDHRKSHIGDKPFLCDQCGKSFKHSLYLHRHKTIHSGIKPYKCEKCGRAFTWKSDLSKHVQTHGGEKETWGCKQCEKSFSYSNSSGKTHPLAKSYKWICEKAFSSLCSFVL